MIHIRQFQHPNPTVNQWNSTKLTKTVMNKISYRDLSTTIIILSSRDTIESFKQMHNISATKAKRSNWNCIQKTWSKQSLRSSQNIQNMLSESSGRAREKNVVSKLCKCMLYGRVNHQICKVLYGSCLFALEKNVWRYSTYRSWKILWSSCSKTSMTYY